MHPDPRIPYGLLVDKLRVKEIFAGQNTIKIAKTLFFTNDPETISLENLPSTFIMKANNGCNCALKVREGVMRPSITQHFSPKPVTNEILKRYATDWLHSHYAHKFGERQYSKVTPMILFEEYLDKLLYDIEFFCFYGKVRLLKVGFYKHEWKDLYFDLDWNLLATNTPGIKVEKPVWLEKIIDFTEKLAKNIDHVRVDYYACEEGIYFGEFTFTTGLKVVPRRLQKLITGFWLYPDQDTVDENFGKIPDLSTSDPEIN